MAFSKGLSAFKSIATGVANACGTAVTNLNFTGRAGVVFSVVNTVFYITTNTVIGFTFTVVFHNKYPF